MTTTRRTRLLRSARVRGGHAKFRAHQLVASQAVPLYRRLRSIDTPLAEGYLFVVAHPRSGSTVLSHVLQSHADIVGFGEHHESYTRPEDLYALAARNAFFDRDPVTTRRYTLDKIVWNHHEIAEGLLARPDTRFVFLVREPVATLESYRQMFHDMTTDERRLRSYRTRFDGMVAQAEAIGDPERMMFIDYEQLTNDTRATLERLTEWLVLDTPLTPEYDLNAKSGSQSWGDPSVHIQAGTIISVDRQAVDINLDVADIAHRVYESGSLALQALTTRTARPAERPPVGESR